MHQLLRTGGAKFCVCVQCTQMPEKIATAVDRLTTPGEQHSVTDADVLRFSVCFIFVYGPTELPALCDISEPRSTREAVIVARDDDGGFCNLSSDRLQFGVMLDILCCRHVRMRLGKTQITRERRV